MTIIGMPGRREVFTTVQKHTFTVPDGVDQLAVTVEGAKGSGGYLDRPEMKGGRAAGVLNVTPGETLNVYVGGEGSTSDGGFNGGAPPGGESKGADLAGGGGGASDIRQGGDSNTDRVVVAGGGGGAGYTTSNDLSYDTDESFGGAGGADSGADGGDGSTTNGSVLGGGGGTQSSGGSADATNAPTVIQKAEDGYFGRAGEGGAGYYDTGTDVVAAEGGGGGGGWYHGGGGAIAINTTDNYNIAVGGGGGSNYTGGLATVTQNKRGVRENSGRVIISW